MYEIGRKVYVKSCNRTGKISDRGYHRITPRRAWYLVEFDDLGGQNGDFMTGSADLRAADFNCDGCGRWLPISSRAGGPRDEDGSLLAEYCFLCRLEDEEALR